MGDSKKMILIIADDLTGANDTGVQYKKSGFSTIVKVLPDSREDGTFDQYDVICINADTRPLSSQGAYNEVYTLTKKLKNKNFDYIYKKIDSIMRGNPASELEAVMDAMGFDVAIVAPSFPDNNRIIEKGILNMPDQSQIDVTKIFNDETKRKAVNIPLASVRQGEVFLKQAIKTKQNEGCEIFVIDALTDDDLFIIRNTCNQIEDKKILCGSAGFAKQLSKKSYEPPKTIHIINQEKITMIIVGSRNGQTAEQVKRVSDLYNAPIVLVDANEIRDGDYHKAIEDTEKSVMNLIVAGKKLIVVSITSLFEDFAISLRNSEDENIKSLRIAKCLGTVVKNINERVSIGNIISTGGDTSLQICNAFETVGIELEDEVASGIPMGKMIGGVADQMTIVTKSGGFGDRDALVKAVEYLGIERSITHDQLSS